MNRVQAYLWRNFAALSQLLNALSGGSQDQTLSSRAIMNSHRALGFVAYRFINALFFWQKDHCMRSLDADERTAVTYLAEIRAWRVNRGHSMHQPGGPDP